MVGRPQLASLRTCVLLSILLLSACTPALAVTDTADGGTVGSAAVTADDRSLAMEASDGDTIHRTLELSLTPETPGEIAATATFSMPGDVRSLETTLPGDATVTSTSGFTASGDNTYTWDGDTSNPTIQFTVPANETADGVRAANGNTPGRHRSTQSGAYSFVDAGSWALVTVPQLSTRWRYVGDRVTLEKSASVAGAGATGGEIAFLGRHRVVERTAHGQTFTFVVPRAADLRESPADILDSTMAASDALRIGGRDDHVFMVAAPTTVTWTAAGIEFGGSDYWVKADERLSDPRNVWLHEYVHTRQDYRAGERARWTIEAGAEYYAALLSLRQNRIDFDDFRRHLGRGTREPVASSILADQSTWASGTPYLKGALVFGNVDREIRLDTNRTRSMQTVLSQMNTHPDEVTASELYSFVEAAGTAHTRSYIERYAGTRAVPSAWTASEHETAFAELPARVSYQATDLRVSGEYRNTSYSPAMVLTTGETLTAVVEVSNDGGADSDYETVMYVGETAVATATGRIDAEATRTVTLNHTFDEPGRYVVRVDGLAQTIVVDSPTEPKVSEFVVNATHADAQWTASVTVTLANPTDRPARGTIPITIDGETVATLDVSLAPGASTTRTVTSNITSGNHTITAGNTSTTIDVPSAPSPASPISTPGFGLATAGIALLLFIIASTRTE